MYTCDQHVGSYRIRKTESWIERAIFSSSKTFVIVDTPNPSYLKASDLRSFIPLYEVNQAIISLVVIDNNWSMLPGWV